MSNHKEHEENGTIVGNCRIEINKHYGDAYAVHMQGQRVVINGDVYAIVSRVVPRGTKGVLVEIRTQALLDDKFLIVRWLPADGYITPELVSPYQIRVQIKFQITEEEELRKEVSQTLVAVA